MNLTELRYSFFGPDSQVENRFEDAITPREVQPGVGGTGRGYQVTPVHPSGDIGPFIDLTDPSGLPSVHGESAWGPRTFDFFDENCTPFPPCPPYYSLTTIDAHLVRLCPLRPFVLIQLHLFPCSPLPS